MSTHLFKGRYSINSLIINYGIILTSSSSFQPSYFKRAVKKHHLRTSKWGPTYQMGKNTYFKQCFRLTRWYLRDYSEEIWSSGTYSGENLSVSNYLFKSWLWNYNRKCFIWYSFEVSIKILTFTTFALPLPSNAFNVCDNIKPTHNFH